MQHTIDDLDEATLRCILLDVTDQDDLITHVSVCARVCSAWRHIVRTSLAYWDKSCTERGQVLQQLSFWLHAIKPWLPGEEERREALLEPYRARPPIRLPRELIAVNSRNPGILSLSNHTIGADGCLALWSALNATPPSTLQGISNIGMYNTGLTAPSARLMASVLPSIGDSSLTNFRLGCNPGIGDAALAALMCVLPQSLASLSFADSGCGDLAMAALANRLSTLSRLENIECQDNPAVGDASWAAFATGLPSTRVHTIRARRNRGMGCVATSAFASVLPRIPTLMLLMVGSNGAKPESRAELQRAWQVHETAYGSAWPEYHGPPRPRVNSGLGPGRADRGIDL